MESMEGLRKKVGRDYVKLYWRRIFKRKISIYLTWFLIQTPITPNQVTFLMLITGLISAWFFTKGIYFYSLIAIFFLTLSSFLDACDGEVARYRNKYSSNGTYLDLMVHIIVDPLIILSIAIGIYLNNPSPIPNYVFLILGFLGMYGLLMSSIVKLKRYELYVTSGEIEKLKKVHKEIIPPDTNNIKREITEFIKIHKILNIVFFFGIFNLLSYLTIIYAIIFPLQAVINFISIFKSKKL